MYLSKSVVLAAYTKLSTLSDDPTQQGAKQIVSAIRYLFAMDAFCRESGKKCCDTTTSGDKQTFSRLVSDIVAVTPLLYTPAFYIPLQSRGADCGTGSNFFSAGQVATSRAAPLSVHPYPKRSGWKALLEAKAGKVTILDNKLENGWENCKSYFGSEERQAAFFIWIARNWNCFADKTTLVNNLKTETLKHYSDTLVRYLFPKDSAFDLILAGIDPIVTNEPFVVSSAEIAGLFADTEKMEAKTPFSQPNWTLQRIYYGAPGTGKSRTIKDEIEKESVLKDRVFRTTFHPDSDYASFVGSYKPTMENPDEEDCTEVFKVTKAKGQEERNLDEIHRPKGKRIVYKFVPQVFLKAYVKAWEEFASSSPSPVVLVIEEINRGNCAQIFGDLFQLLDRHAETGFSEYPIVPDDDIRCHLTGVLENAAKSISDERKDEIDEALAAATEAMADWDDVSLGKALVLPPNLYIWATMNTSDQSLFPMDSAFKRRWDWKYVPIRIPEKKEDGTNWEDWTIRIPASADGTKPAAEYAWWDFLETINERIGDLTSSEDKKLGYFFVKADSTGEVPLEAFVNKVVFYLWNDAFRAVGTEELGFEVEVSKKKKDGSEEKKKRPAQFEDFFKPNGDPDAERIREFLTKLEVPSK